MTDIAALLRLPGASVAVVGATDNRNKYGNTIYRDLRDKGYPVFAVNPSRTTVEGDPCWPDLESLPERPTIVNVVVPPSRTLGVLDEMRRLGLNTVWVQPGAADRAVRTAVADGGFSALIDACIMVQARKAVPLADDPPPPPPDPSA